VDVGSPTDKLSGLKCWDAGLAESAPPSCAEILLFCFEVECRAAVRTTGEVSSANSTFDIFEWIISIDRCPDVCEVGGVNGCIGLPPSEEIDSLVLMVPRKLGSPAISLKESTRLKGADWEAPTDFDVGGLRALLLE
jgi:hypothetical protein